MKKLILASLVAIAPAIATAQVQLISGFNFGQFLYGGEPVTDYASGSLPVAGFIQSNYGGNVVPGPEDGGAFKIANGVDGTFVAGTSTLYFDGSNGSSNFDPFGGGAPGSVTVNELAALDATNAQTVNPIIQMYSGDDNNAGLRLVNNGSSVNAFSIVTNTLGFEDYTTGLIANDANFSFAAFANSAGASVQFFHGATNLGSFNVNQGGFQAFSFDLPVQFYGMASASIVGLVSGDIVFDHIQINGNLAAIPEPSTYAAILGAVTLGFVAWRRRREATSLA